MSGGGRLVRFRGVECQLEPANGGVRVSLCGEVDIAVAGELGSWLQAAPTGSEGLDLDLTKITFMDSTGLHMLIRLRRELGQRFRVVAVSEPVRGLLGVTGLKNFFD